MYAYKQGIIDNAIISKELCILSQDVHDALFVFVSHLEDIFLIEKIKVFQGHCSVDLYSRLVFDCLSTIGRSFQIIPLVYLFIRLKDIVHDAKVYFLAHFPTLSVENYLMQTKYSTNHRVSVLLSQIFVIILQNFLQLFKLMTRNGFQHESSIVRIVEERATFSRRTKLGQSLEIALEYVA